MEGAGAVIGLLIPFLIADAILARDGDGAAAAMRALLRHSATRRARASGPADPALPTLNILIAIAGAYFGQDEELAQLWEEP